jgi:hypothetical protein
METQSYFASIWYANCGDQCILSEAIALFSWLRYPDGSVITLKIESVTLFKHAFKSRFLLGFIGTFEL